MEDILNVFELEKFLDKLEERINILRDLKKQGKLSNPQELEILESKTQKIIEELKIKIHPFNRVQIARHPKRPVLQDIIDNVFSDFIELKGDRYVGDDLSITAGMAKLGDYPVFVIGHNKGKTTNEKIKRNYGMSNPEGFYKAIRVMDLANNFRTPLITIVDTPGAYPGDNAEQNGQYIAIAKSISKMFELDIPVLCLILSEGGSGGALAIAVANYILMMENAYYSVISPEGAASILYRDSSKSAVAAKNLKLTSYDLLELGVVDEIIYEPFLGMHRDLKNSFSNIKNKLFEYIEKSIKLKDLKEHRFKKFRKIGYFDNISNYV
ncbi:MAG: acetyl-CoA carboxylase carboxyltransferase subunit alpha [Candidatus Calescibacterium sp.]|nr:acetyl-CoA carboxylase carboxyltransferase subunit alpha [Candidatus Calescibacterium sp.]MDW8132638.1 acetyl-CoA carboxylase carboxyltransferase subunit alpha [Candidatus Calescibacterium sp.]